MGAAMWSWTIALAPSWTTGAFAMADDVAQLLLSACSGGAAASVDDVDKPIAWPLP